VDVDVDVEVDVDVDVDVDVTLPVMEVGEFIHEIDTQFTAPGTLSVLVSSIRKFRLVTLWITPTEFTVVSKSEEIVEEDIIRG